MKQVDVAWAAGFFDGEGTVRIHNRSLEAGLTNTFLPSLIWFRKRFGGSLSAYTRKSDKHRPAFRWKVYGKSAHAFLTTIIPYLKEKKPQAQIAVAWSSRPDRTAEVTENARAELSDMKRPQYSLKEISELEEAYRKKNGTARRRRCRVQGRVEGREAHQLGRRHVDASRRRGRRQEHPRRTTQGARIRA
jgi:hypothetical protein